MTTTPLITEWKALHCDAINDGINPTVTEAIAAISIVCFCLDEETLKILPEEEFRFTAELPQYIKDWVVTHTRTFENKSSFACIPSCSIAVYDVGTTNYIHRVGDLVLSESRDAILHRLIMTPASLCKFESVFPGGSYPSFIQYGFLPQKVRAKMARGELVV
jgi:hypothetical protein